MKDLHSRSSTDAAWHSFFNKNGDPVVSHFISARHCRCEIEAVYDFGNVDKTLKGLCKESLFKASEKFMSKPSRPHVFALINSLRKSLLKESKQKAFCNPHDNTLFESKGGKVAKGATDFAKSCCVQSCPARVGVEKPYRKIVGYSLYKRIKSCG